MSSPRVTVVIATPTTSHRLDSQDDRNVAQPAERILRGLGADVRPAIFWVECEDKRVQSLLTSYLTEVKAEVMTQSRSGEFQTQGGRGFRKTRSR